MIPLRTTKYSKFGVITFLIILLNFIVFIYSIIEGKANFLYKYGCIPVRIIHLDGMATLLTSMFLHASFIHFLGNMWFLYLFGHGVEEWLGSFSYLFFYLLCGIVASIAQILFSPFSKIPIVGASGAVAGVMGGYFVLFPRTGVLCLFPILFFLHLVVLPASLFLVLWLFFQIFSSIFAIHSPIAFWAHIGGFFFGLWLVKRLKSKW